MHRTNQILLQLREADKFANAKSPHYRRLAVILLDNAVELQLGRKAWFEFLCDRTTWYDGVRQHSRKRRREVDRSYPELLSFARDQGWISQEDVTVLRYGHQIRNGLYHQGWSDTLDTELAIRLLYRFIEGTFPTMGFSNGIHFLSPDDPISFDAAFDDETGEIPLHLGFDIPEDGILGRSEYFHTKKYLSDALKHVFTYRPSRSIRDLIQENVTGFLDMIESNIEVLDEHPTLNMYNVISYRCAIFTDALLRTYTSGKKMPVSVALNIYLAMMKDGQEDKLLDIPDQGDRTNAFHTLLNSHAFVADPIPRAMIADYRTKAESISQRTEAEGIALFLDLK